MKVDASRECTETVSRRGRSTQVDRDFVKLMGKAEQTQIVLNCCANELLKNTLPVLYDELERCQKSLEGYLEQKRAIFPRFYFVSNAAILIILSQGSDPLQMQPYYEKVFDSVNQVEHDKSDKGHRPRGAMPAPVHAVTLAC